MRGDTCIDNHALANTLATTPRSVVIIRGFMKSRLPTRKIRNERGNAKRRKRREKGRKERTGERENVPRDAGTSTTKGRNRSERRASRVNFVERQHGSDSTICGRRQGASVSPRSFLVFTSLFSPELYEDSLEERVQE